MVRVNGGAVALGMDRLVAITGDRFLRTSAFESANEDAECSVTRSGRKGLRVPHEELHSVRLVFEIMNETAPDALTLPELAGVLSTCKMFMADALVAGLATYMVPAAMKASAAQVRDDNHQIMAVCCTQPLPMRLETKRNK